MITLYPAPPPIGGDAPAMPMDELSRYRTAAVHARSLHPGPLGELAFRELTAYAEFGYRFSNDGLIPRLAEAVLAMRNPARSATPAPRTDPFVASPP